MGKRIWIMNHYAGGMYFNKNGRHYYFAKYLKINGYEPFVFCCNTKIDIAEQFVPTDRVWTELKDEDYNIPWIFVKSSFYKGNGIARVKNMVLFSRNLIKTGKEYAKRYGKPDVILASSVHPLTLIAGIRLAKIFNIKCICEIRDLWPLSIFANYQQLKKFKLFVKMLYKGEKKIYEKADAIIFTFEGGKQYIKDMKWDVENGGKIDLDKVFHINNGVDLEIFDKNKARYQVNDSDLNDDRYIKLIYTGSIRKANNIDKLLDIAKNIKTPNIKILIYGSGNNVEDLKKKIQQEKIENVIYKGYVKKQEIPFVLSKASFTLMHWRLTSPHYGESLNKSFEYYAAGKPVIYTVHPRYCIAEKYNGGLISDNDTAEIIAADIDAFINISKEEYETLCRNARITAEHYDFKNHTQTLISIIEKLGMNC